MNYLVAVSGGVDSVVLLDMMSRTDHRLVVAHVDHGIREEDSAADARFVEALARRYGLPFVKTELNLGAHASEDMARQRRYEFLFAEAKKFHATVMTAHHQGDVVETIAINLKRGTGWRGLAVMDRSGIVRPLLSLRKVQLYEYATRHHLEWSEDATNHTNAYLRNRMRRRLAAVPPRNIEAIAKLRSVQLQLRRDIDREARRIMTRHAGSRYFLSQLDESVGGELLGEVIVEAGGVRPTRPQIKRALLAIKLAKPGTSHDIDGHTKLRFTARKYQITVV